eukprot:TRINITY_DN9182_c0_g3_i1.p1 TRINITY_DN9182_c0_g3~~TRINITY_DN9182_c0_g3_i1.p1  ORF type:complete len:176 (+),score=54.27 TRINITY_DN9182_c0_g3_i1:175-702(+)
MASPRAVDRPMRPFLLAAAAALLLGLQRSFVPAPPSREAAAAAAAAAALMAPAQAALAVLPPLEDLPLDEIAPTRTKLAEKDADTFMGISFQAYLFVLLGAVTWAITWILNLKPAKDAEGTYRTYLGGGMLPPEGFTNPADPRVQEEVTDEDDELYGDLRPGAAKGAKAASSAIV